jgi:hypothetical protein
MVRLALSLLLFAGAALDLIGLDVDRPLAIAGLGVAAALLVTVALDAGRLQAFREKFPAHLDSDRFTLEL